MQAAEVDAGPDDAALCPRLEDPPRRAREVAAPRRGADHRVGVPPGQGAALLDQLVAQGLDPRDAEGGVERGVEVPGLLQEAQEGREELRSHRELHDLGPVGLADALLLQDLRLADLSAVVAFLDDDAVEPAHGGLGGHRRAVVAAGRRNDALVPQVLRLMDGDRRPPGLEAPGGVAGLVLHEDARALAGGRIFSGEPGEVPELQKRRVADPGLGLDAAHLLHGVADLAHQPFVIETDALELEGAVIDPERRLHDLVPARVEPLVGQVPIPRRHDRSSPASSSRSCICTRRSSGTKLP